MGGMGREGEDPMGGMDGMGREGGMGGMGREGWKERGGERGRIQWEDGERGMDGRDGCQL